MEGNLFISFPECWRDNSASPPGLSDPSLRVGGNHTTPTQTPVHPWLKPKGRVRLPCACTRGCEGSPFPRRRTPQIAKWCVATTCVPYCKNNEKGRTSTDESYDSYTVLFYRGCSGMEFLCITLNTLQKIAWVVTVVVKGIF